MPFLRKVFLVLCASGMGIGAIVFSGIFWVSSHTESLIFGNANLNELLANNILVVVTLVLFVGSFQFGFGPMRYTLLGELFEPREQVKTLTPSSLFVAFSPGDDRKPGPQHVLAFWLCRHQVVPAARIRVRAHHHLRWRCLCLLLQRPLHNRRHSGDEGENRESSATRCSRIRK